jgi:hypothetical protein
MGEDMAAILAGGAVAGPSEDGQKPQADAKDAGGARARRAATC